MRSPGWSVGSIEPDGTQYGFATNERTSPVMTSDAASGNHALRSIVRHHGEAVLRPASVVTHTTVTAAVRGPRPRCRHRQDRPILRFGQPHGGMGP